MARLSRTRAYGRMRARRPRSRGVPTKLIQTPVPLEVDSGGRQMGRKSRRTIER